MARLTILFGIILFLLGVLTYMGTGRGFPTSLIPAAFGLVLALCGWFARTEDVRRRMLAMHVAVTIALVGFLATVKSYYDFAQMKMGKQFRYPIAVDEKVAMASLLLVFIVLCVRSFIAARRARA